MIRDAALLAVMVFAAKFGLKLFIGRFVETLLPPEGEALEFKLMRPIELEVGATRLTFGASEVCKSSPS